MFSNMRKFFLFSLAILMSCSFANFAISEDTQETKSNSNTIINLFTGVFDYRDEVGDDKTNLFGVEHKNSELYRDTFMGKLLPISGGFITGKNSVYLYTGVAAQYRMGPINISPSFAPGYYNKGDGKNLGSALEFKSEISLSLDLFEQSQIGYSYNHMSNNDWGSVNPGTDNQIISFSTKF